MEQFAKKELKEGTITLEGHDQVDRVSPGLKPLNVALGVIVVGNPEQSYVEFTTTLNQGCSGDRMASCVMDSPNRGHISEQVNNVISRLDCVQHLRNATTGLSRCRSIEFCIYAGVRCKKLGKLAIQAAHKNLDFSAGLLL